ncbi:MAG: hypothetical protein ACI92B_001530 [Marinobacter maritimus]|jgi:hypothetical protein|tara:strand:+ start:350 stop:556 length:207 start_codon:yes stop_codon:yes gene_type:complete
MHKKPHLSGPANRAQQERFGGGTYIAPVQRRPGEGKNKKAPTENQLSLFDDGLGSELLNIRHPLSPPG